MDIYNNYLSYFTEQKHARSFELLPGQGKIIISAPHSVEQTRDKAIKCSEPQTGALARLLHDRTDCPVIYKTRNYGDDANYNARSRYKDALAEYIRSEGILYLLDLHQLSPMRDEIINLGINDGKNIAAAPEFETMVTEIFSKQNIGHISVDKPFKASYPFTVTSYMASHCNISCIQVEINSRLVCEGFDDFCFYELADALEDIVKKANAKG